MEQIELDISDKNLLEFDVEIQGITSEKVDVKFIIESDGVDFAFDGTLEDGTVSIDIPMLNKFLEPKTYSAKMAFVVEGNRYFEPLHVMAELVQPVSITTSIKESTKKTVTAPATSVNEESISVSTIKVTPKKDLMERMADALPIMKEATSVADIIGIYKKEVLLNENSKVSNKEAVEFIDTYCRGEFGKSFKEYIK